jgi:hypothetical protein
VEKSAKKLLVIYQELHKRMVPTKKMRDECERYNIEENGEMFTLDDDYFERIDTEEVIEDDAPLSNKKVPTSNKGESNKKKKAGKPNADMRHMLGFLN